MLYLRGRVVCLWLWRRTGNHHKIELAAMVRRELEAQRQTEDCLLACLLLLVLAALTNQSRRFGFRLSFFFFLDGPRRGIPAFSSQLVAHRGDRAAAALPPFGTAHSASGVSESAGGRSSAQLVRSQRPAGRPARRALPGSQPASHSPRGIAWPAAPLANYCSVRTYAWCCRALSFAESSERSSVPPATRTQQGLGAFEMGWGRWPKGAARHDNAPEERRGYNGFSVLFKM